MHESSARNLRTGERFLLAPPLPASFGPAQVTICDISAKGARFRHDKPLETGAKAVLRLPVEGRVLPLPLEAVVVWTHSDTVPGTFVSGVRTYGSPEMVNTLLTQLHGSRRSNRIEEMRSTDRFFVHPAIEGLFGDRPVRLDDLSTRGARIDCVEQLPPGTTGNLVFAVPDTTLEVSVAGTVIWTQMKAITGSGTRYRSGLRIGQRAEILRLAIAHLCESSRAALDTQSLRLKLKVMRARARQLAPSHPAATLGIPSEQYLLIQGVREELRLNPEEAMHWYRRARATIADPQTREIAAPIADHPDALAVWEYLDRTIDATIVGRAFALK